MGPTQTPTPRPAGLLRHSADRPAGISIYVDTDRITDLHAADLGLAIIGLYPKIVNRDDREHDREHARAGGDVFADARLAVGDDAVDRCPDRGVGERKLGREQSRFGGTDPRLSLVFVRLDHHKLLVLVGEACFCLIDLRMGLHLCRLGIVERSLGSEPVLGQNRCPHQSGVGILHLRLRRAQSCWVLRELKVAVELLGHPVH